ncbi:MAG: tyrosine-type recombinase/integrase [Rhodospirillales bacterium]
MRYTVGGKEKLYAAGTYPEISLARARQLRDEALAMARDGRDPVEARAEAKRPAPLDPDKSFEAVARRWHEKNKPIWRKRHAWDVLHSLDRDIFPKIGKRPIADITAPELLGVLNEIEARGAVETAHRIRQRCSAVFIFGIASGLCQLDPAGVIKPALAPVIRGHQPAITDVDGVRRILAEVSRIPSHPATLLALRFIALTVVRPGELRSASWEQFKGLNGAEPLWEIPAELMKMKRSHLVPLARQAVEVLEQARRFSKHHPFVFANIRNPRRPMSENTLGYAMHRAGFHGQHCAHGWRAAFSTIMNERYRADRQVIDLMLAHASDDKTEAAYNRAMLMDRRRELAQIWADLLLEGAPSAEALISGPRRSVPLA